jgi:hypothetical protein
MRFIQVIAREAQEMAEDGICRRGSKQKATAPEHGCCTRGCEPSLQKAPIVCVHHNARIANTMGNLRAQDGKSHHLFSPVCWPASGLAVPPANCYISQPLCTPLTADWGSSDAQGASLEGERS